VRARHVVAIACVGLLILAASAGADPVSSQPSSDAVAPVAAGPAEAPAPTATAAPAAPPAPIPTAVAEAAAPVGATPAPTPTAVVEATAPVEATPAPTPMAVSEPTGAAETTPVPTVMASAVGAATVAGQATSARAVRVAVAAQATPPPEPASPAPAGGCATPVEPLEGVEGVTEAPSVEGVCRVSAAVCSILGTDGDDVLTGSPFDDILCGLGGNDRLEGGDGNDVLFGGEGDDELSGGEGDDCMIGGPGFDEADNTGGTGRPPTPPDEMADIRGPDGEIPEWPETDIADVLGTGPEAHIWMVSTGVTFDAHGRCTGASGYAAVSPPPPVNRPGRAHEPSAPAGTATIATAAASSGSGGARLGLPDGRLAVRNNVVRVRVSCSARVPAELVLLAGSQRIAHKRFTCTAPEKTVRVRLNDVGRELVADDDRVQARVLVLAAGSTVSRQVKLVSRGA
jgi:hypothetical protein